MTANEVCAQDGLASDGDDAALGLLALGGARSTEGPGAGGGIRCRAVKVSSTENIGGAALGVAVEADGADRAVVVTSGWVAGRDATAGDNALAEDVLASNWDDTALGLLADGSTDGDGVVASSGDAAGYTGCQYALKLLLVYKLHHLRVEQSRSSRPRTSVAQHWRLL